MYQYCRVTLWNEIVFFCMTQTFQRCVEDFTCGHCGATVLGDGYTNHCPRCLRSRHVDMYPGDRLATCGGIMEPLFSLFERRKWRIVHRCIACGYEKKNRLAEDDDMAIFSRLPQKST